MTTVLLVENGDIALMNESKVKLVCIAPDSADHAIRRPMLSRCAQEAPIMSELGYALLNVCIGVAAVVAATYLFLRRARGPRTRRFTLIWVPLVGAYAVGYSILLPYLTRRNLVGYAVGLSLLYFAGLFSLVFWANTRFAAARREGGVEGGRSD